MSHYTIELADGSELDASGDQVTVESGALKFSTDGATALVIAPRVWRSVRAVGS